MAVTQNLAQKWKLDVSSRSSALRPTSAADSLNPPGYFPSAAGAHHVAETSGRDTQQQHLLTKRAWDTALGPVKQLPMNMFVMYMAGSTISIFPIMMVCMMAWRPIKALMALQATFKGLEMEMGSTLILHKLVFVLGNLLAVCLAVYKCAGMGLLPTHASDWLDFVEAAQRMEFGVGSVVYS